MDTKNNLSGLKEAEANKMGKKITKICLPVFLSKQTGLKQEEWAWIVKAYPPFAKWQADSSEGKGHFISFCIFWPVVTHSISQ